MSIARRQEFPQGYGIIFLSFFAAEDKGCRAISDLFTELFYCIWPGLQFRGVAAFEFRPFFRIMLVPAAQFAGEGQLFAPIVDPQLIFADSARPEAIDENPSAIAGGRFIVGAFEFDYRCFLSL